MMDFDKKIWLPMEIKTMFSEYINGKAKGHNHLIDVKNGGVEYIGATNKNNGVLGFVSVDDGDEHMLQQGNCIGFIRNGDGAAGYAIYRESEFVSTPDVIYGYADWLNVDSGLFFVVCQDLIKPKYSHGHKRNKERLMKDRVMLPVTENEEPDYDYMEKYVAEMREMKLTQYREYVKKRIDELGDYVEIPTLDEKKWLKFNAFGYNGILDIATTSSSVDKIRLRDNDGMKILPYITRTDKNNGIALFVDEENLVFNYDEGCCITVGLDTQTAFWQPSRFITGQNIQIITGDILNEYVALFLIPLIKKQMEAKFNWGGNGATLGRMLRLELLLPIDKAGDPDYAYMEQYSKNMMLSKYKEYLAYLEKNSD